MDETERGISGMMEVNHASRAGFPVSSTGRLLMPMTTLYPTCMNNHASGAYLHTKTSQRHVIELTPKHLYGKLLDLDSSPLTDPALPLTCPPAGSSILCWSGAQSLPSASLMAQLAGEGVTV
jgi:hypothetical protein